MFGAAAITVLFDMVSSNRKSPVKVIPPWVYGLMSTMFGSFGQMGVVSAFRLLNGAVNGSMVTDKLIPREGTLQSTTVNWASGILIPDGLVAGGLVDDCTVD